MDERRRQEITDLGEPWAGKCEEHGRCFLVYKVASNQPVGQGWYHATFADPVWEIRRLAGELVATETQPAGSYVPELFKTLGHKVVAKIQALKLFPFS